MARMSQCTTTKVSRLGLSAPKMERWRNSILSRMDLEPKFCAIINSNDTYYCHSFLIPICRFGSEGDKIAEDASLV